MARERKINIRLSDEEYAVIPQNCATFRADVDFCREALTKYAQPSGDSCALYVKV